MTIRTYSELVKFRSFEERFEYLKLKGSVGKSTFGFDRYLNQRFYMSMQWKYVRNQVIARDLGCDLGIEDRVIFDKIIIHHMNPMSADDLTQGNESVLDTEFLVCTTMRTHNAIHYGDADLLLRLPPERRPGDTKLW